MNDLVEIDMCDDCRAYGDDWELDDDGELVQICSNCPHCDFREHTGIE